MQPSFSSFPVLLSDGIFLEYLNSYQEYHFRSSFSPFYLIEISVYFLLL